MISIILSYFFLYGIACEANLCSKTQQKLSRVYHILTCAVEACRTFFAKGKGKYRDKPPLPPLPFILVF